MPGYRTHLIGGVFASALMGTMIPVSGTTWQHAGAASIACMLTSACIGAIFPDIDTKSKAQIIFYRLLVPLIVFAIMMQAWPAVGTIGVIGALPVLVNHRGLTHNPRFLLVVAMLIAIGLSVANAVQPQLALAMSAHFCIGAFSHIILDMGFKRTWRRFSR